MQSAMVDVIQSAMVDIVHVCILLSQSPNQVRRRQGESVGANLIEFFCSLQITDMKNEFSASCGASPALATGCTSVKICTHCSFIELYTLLTLSQASWISRLRPSFCSLSTLVERVAIARKKILKYQRDFTGKENHLQVGRVGSRDK